MKTTIKQASFRHFTLAGIALPALIVAATTLYASTAEASCTDQPAGSNSFICSGTTTTTQTINAPNNSSFTTDSTYSIIIPGPTFGVAALFITGSGAKSFIDTNAMLVDTTLASLNAINIGMGFDLPGNPASLTFHSNGTFRTLANGVIISGLNGSPESGFLDLALTGTVSARFDGLVFSTPGQGGTVTVNNIISSDTTAINGIFGNTATTEAIILGDQTINTTGLVSGAGASSAGITMRMINSAVQPLGAGVKMTINVGQNSIVEGTTAALSITSTLIGGMENTDHPVTVNNDGIIRNISQSTAGVAIQGFGVPANINTSSTRFFVNNRNLLVGTVRFGKYDDAVDNTGTWNTAGGVNDMGPGNNTINNQAAGTIIAANNPNAAQTTRFDNVTTFTHAGVITMQDGFAGDSTIISGTFIGQNGTVKLDTYLGTDNSPSDKLVLNGGRATGLTSLLITNTTGVGELTTGNGILVVEAINGATTDPTAFRLGQRVAAGAYEYMLFYGGNASAGGNPGDQNWYLRNTLIPEPPPPGCETTNTCPSQPPVPIVRVEVPISMVIPPLAIEYGYAMLDTLHERVGETWLNAGPVTEERVVWCKDPKTNFKCVVRVSVASANGAAKDETRWARAGWARLIGDRGLHQPDNFMRRGPNYDYTFGGIQAGLDIYAREQADGALDKAGIYVGYGQITSDVKGQFGAKAGSVDMDAYTLAGYWTHHSPNGWYTDAVVQGTWYSANAKSIYNQQVKPDGFGILASLEGGYAFKLNNGWTLEPQAQIVYQNVSFDHAHDTYGFVRFDDGDSLRGRLGVRLTKTWNMADQGKEARLLTAWLRGNIWHEFLGKTTTSWGSLDGQNMTPFNSYLGGTWGEIGAGVTAQMTDKINLFATGAYNRSLDNKGREGWDGRLGATVKW